MTASREVDIVFLCEMLLLPQLGIPDSVFSLFRIIKLAIDSNYACINAMCTKFSTLDGWMVIILQFA